MQREHLHRCLPQLSLRRCNGFRSMSCKLQEYYHDVVYSPRLYLQFLPTNLWLISIIKQLKTTSNEWHKVCKMSQIISEHIFYEIGEKYCSSTFHKISHLQEYYHDVIYSSRSYLQLLPTNIWLILIIKWLTETSNKWHKVSKMS